MSELTAEAIGKIESLAQTANGVKVFTEDGEGEEFARPFAAVPKGLALVDLKPYLDPEPTARALFEEPDSFAEYVNRFRNDRTLLGVEPSALRFRACIDYHNTDVDAEPCRHFAQLTLEKSPELREWTKAFNAWISQPALAEWLEDHAHEVSSHSAAEILTVARSLEAAKNIDFKSAQRESDGGWNFAYSETTTGKAGDFDVPGRITVSVALFAGGEPVEIECLMRYRVNGGGLEFKIRPLRLEEAIREAVAKIRAAIAEQTELFVHAGDVFNGMLAASDPYSVKSDDIRMNGAEFAKFSKEDLRPDKYR